MVRVKMVFESGCLKQLVSEGHAKKGFLGAMKILVFRRAKRIPLAREVCAAVSTLEYQFIYSMKRLTRVLFETEVTLGLMSVQVKRCSSSDRRVLRVLSQSLCIGLEMVREKHPNNIHIQLQGDVYG